MEPAINFKYSTALAAVSSLLIAATIKKKNSKRNRKIWTKNWLLRRCLGKDVLFILNKELKYEDKGAYNNFLRMTDTQFNNLLSMVGPYIGKKEHHYA